MSGVEQEQCLVLEQEQCPVLEQEQCLAFEQEQCPVFEQEQCLVFEHFTLIFHKSGFQDLVKKGPARAKLQNSPTQTISLA